MKLFTPGQLEPDPKRKRDVLAEAYALLAEIADRDTDPEDDPEHDDEPAEAA